jgi:hypothetical protein
MAVCPLLRGTSRRARGEQIAGESALTQVIREEQEVIGG